MTIAAIAILSGTFLLSAAWEVVFGSAGVVRQFAAIKASDIESLFGLSRWESPVRRSEIALQPFLFLEVSQ
jgi:hypothetical protein